MRVIKVSPRKVAKVVELENTLESLQNAVGGYIETIYPFEENVCLICNEEGKLNGSEPCRALRDGDDIYDIIFGDFLVVGITEDADFCSLSDEEIAKYLALYERPEVFYAKDRRIEVIRL